jgi:microcystin-dependent protein
MSTPFLAQIEIFSFNFAPKGWALCNGQLLPINQNQALFSLLGTMYGGDGRVNFGLPDLRSRIPVSMGPQNTIGTRSGQEAHTVIISEMPGHNHMVNVDATTAATSNAVSPATNEVLGLTAGQLHDLTPLSINMYATGAGNTTLDQRTIGNTGGSQAHNNLQPYLTLNFCIALQGIFPSQN